MKRDERLQVEFPLETAIGTKPTRGDVQQVRICLCKSVFDYVEDFLFWRVPFLGATVTLWHSALPGCHAPEARWDKVSTVSCQIGSN